MQDTAFVTEVFMTTGRVGRSEYFRTRFRSEVGQSADAASIDVSGVSGSLLRILIEAMYSHEVCS